jgi:hypothetical protein
LLVPAEKSLQTLVFMGFYPTEDFGTLSQYREIVLSRCRQFAIFYLAGRNADTELADLDDRKEE